MNLDQETLQHRLDEIPATISPHIKMGYHLLSRLNSQVNREFVVYLIEITERGESLDRERAIEITGLSKSTINDCLTAVATAIGSLVDIDVTSEDFIQFGRGKVFDASDEEAAKQVAQLIVDRRNNLKRGMRDSALANSVLPSFQSLHLEVDLRVGFEKDDARPTSVVPLAVCYLETDTDKAVWFQATPRDIDNIIKKLTQVSKKIKAAIEISNRLAAQ